MTASANVLDAFGVESHPSRILGDGSTRIAHLARLWWSLFGNGARGPFGVYETRC